MKARYLVQRALNMNYKAMLDKIGSIHKKTGRSRWAIFQDMRQCAVRYGAGYMDYDLFEMYDLTPEQRDTYLTRGRNNDIVVKYNDKGRRAGLPGPPRHLHGQALPGQLRLGHREAG